MTTLTELLQEKIQKSSEVIPEDKKKIMEKSTAILKGQTLASKAIKKGDILPEFSLPNATNKMISLSDFKNDYIIISFYRGGWCPYCNLELKALQNILPQLSKLGAVLIAISPETPDNSLNTTEKNNLSFSVLSDIDNKYAKSLGLVFKMPEDLQKVYKDFNLNVNQFNGNEDYELPMPATYVVNHNREIIYSFIPEDYRERLDPEKILEILKQNND